MIGMEVCYWRWNGQKRNRNGIENDSINFTDMDLKCWGFYSNVGDTTLKARAVSGQSIFVKKDEEKFYGEDERKVIVS